jgi:hypothetical protein
MMIHSLQDASNYLAHFDRNKPHTSDPQAMITT